MTSKVFLIDKSWLYCKDVEFKEGIWAGHVINGHWYLRYDTIKKTLNTTESIMENRELMWMCDPCDVYNYNAVIVDAQERFENGEKANYDI
jgi:hypothetical protein